MSKNKFMPLMHKSTGEQEQGGRQDEETNQTDTAREDTQEQQAAPETATETKYPEAPVTPPVAVVVKQEALDQVLKASTPNMFEGVLISDNLVKVIERVKETPSAIETAKFLMSYYKANKAGVPQDDESCARAARSLLANLTNVLKDAVNFQNRYLVVTAFAREFSDTCFSPTLLFRGAPSLAETEYLRFTGIGTLVVESSRLVNPKKALITLDINKLMRPFNDTDMTNRVLAWYGE